MIENGKVYSINNRDYIVVSTFEDYAMLLNITETEEQGSGNMIVVQVDQDGNATVIKDKELLTHIVNNMLNQDN